MEVNLKVNTQRVGEWRRGKWVRWISATQKIDPESGLIVGLGTSKNVLSDSALIKPGMTSVNLEILNNMAQLDSSSFGNNVESYMQDIGRNSVGQANTAIGVY